MPTINEVAQKVARRRQLEAEQLAAREKRAADELEEILDRSNELALVSFKLRFMLAQVDATLATVAKLSTSNIVVNDLTTGALIQAFDTIEKAFPSVLDALEKDIEAEVVSADTCNCDAGSDCATDASTRKH